MALTTARQREMARLLRKLCPQMPLADFGPVVEAAAEKKMKHLPPSVALWQALGARIRHEHTEYEDLLAEGYDRDSARFYVLDDMNAVLARWGCHRRIEAQEPE